MNKPNHLKTLRATAGPELEADLPAERRAERALLQRRREEAPL